MAAPGRDNDTPTPAATHPIVPSVSSLVGKRAPDGRVSFSRTRRGAGESGSGGDRHNNRATVKRDIHLPSRRLGTFPIN